MPPVVQPGRAILRHDHLQRPGLSELRVPWRGALYHQAAALIVERKLARLIHTGGGSRPAKAVTAYHNLLPTDGEIALSNQHSDVLGDDVGAIAGRVDECK